MHALSKGISVSVTILYGFGCGPVTPTPKRASHSDTAEFVKVPQAPDSVQVQVIGKQPDERAVWVDGYWHWSGRRWAWQEGMWVHPPQEGAYAPPELLRLPTYQDSMGSVLLYRPGQWYLPNGDTLTLTPIQGPTAPRQ